MTIRSLVLLVGLSFLGSSPELPNFSGQLFLKQKGQADVYTAVGIADLNHQVPMSRESVFDIASLNKSFIANLVLQAVAEGRWKRSTSLNELLARYQFSARFNKGINLHQMMCHRSGLADYDAVASPLKENEFQAFKRQHFTNTAYLDFIAKLPHQEPNKAFHYSNFAYHILAILLEAEYHMHFDELLAKKIAEPLKMKVLRSPKNREELLPNLTIGYRMREGRFLANDYIDLSLGRRIFCRADELMQWLESGGGRSLLPDSLGNLVMQNHLADLNQDQAYGYGWVSYTAGDHYEMGDLDLAEDYFIHGGSTEGFQSLAVSVNQGETNLVLIANNGDGRALFERAKSILKNIYE